MAALYQLASDAIDGKPYSGVIRTDTGQWVPCVGPDLEEASALWAAYLEWCGPPEAPLNVPDPYLSPAEGGAVIVPGEGGVPYGAMLDSMPADAVLGSAPVNVDVPYVGGDAVVGGTLNCTMGNWEGSPSSYAYAWSGAGLGGSASYGVVEADVGTSITCTVTAVNAFGGATAPPSNAVLIEGPAAAAEAAEAAAPPRNPTPRSGTPRR